VTVKTRLTHIALAALFTAVGATAALADSMQARYDVRLIGAKVGEMAMASTETASAYSTRARFATTGPLSALKQASFDLSAKGRKSGNRLVPTRYSEVTSEGRRSTNLKISFSGGVATQVSGDTGSSAPAVNPRSLPGAYDPLTALYAALRDQAPNQLCSLDADVYDGHRHARLSLTNRKVLDGGRVQCSGQYRRIAGYSQRELRHRTAPVSVIYAPQGSNMRAETVVVRTRYGKVSMHRR
jgi:PAS domain-containing protein